MSNNEVVRKFERAITEYKGLSYKIDFINKEIEMIKNDKLANEEKIIKLNRVLNRYIRFKNAIDMCLNNLNGTERKIIELRYLSKEKLTWKQIANMVSYSEDYCRKNIRNRAINKIIFLLNENRIDIS